MIILVSLMVATSRAFSVPVDDGSFVAIDSNVPVHLEPATIPRFFRDPSALSSHGPPLSKGFYFTVPARVLLYHPPPGNVLPKAPRSGDLSGQDICIHPASPVTVREYVQNSRPRENFEEGARDIKGQPGTSYSTNSAYRGNPQPQYHDIRGEDLSYGMKMGGMEQYLRSHSTHAQRETNENWDASLMPQQDHASSQYSMPSPQYVDDVYLPGVSQYPYNEKPKIGWPGRENSASDSGMAPVRQYPHIGVHDQLSQFPPSYLIGLKLLPKHTESFPHGEPVERTRFGHGYSGLVSPPGYDGSRASPGLGYLSPYDLPVDPVPKTPWAVVMIPQESLFANDYESGIETPWISVIPTTQRPKASHYSPFEGSHDQFVFHNEVTPKDVSIQNIESHPTEPESVSVQPMKELRSEIQPDLKKSNLKESTGFPEASSVSDAIVDQLDQPMTQWDQSQTISTSAETEVPSAKTEYISPSNQQSIEQARDSNVDAVPVGRDSPLPEIVLSGELQEPNAIVDQQTHDISMLSQQPIGNADEPNGDIRTRSIDKTPSDEMPIETNPVEVGDAPEDYLEGERELTQEGSDSSVELRQTTTEHQKVTHLEATTIHTDTEYNPRHNKADIHTTMQKVDQVDTSVRPSMSTVEEVRVEDALPNYSRETFSTQVPQPEFTIQRVPSLSQQSSNEVVLAVENPNTSTSTVLVNSSGQVVQHVIGHRITPDTDESHATVMGSSSDTTIDSLTRTMHSPSETVQHPVKTISKDSAHYVGSTEAVVQDSTSEQATLPHKHNSSPETDAVNELEFEDTQASVGVPTNSQPIVEKLDDIETTTIIARVPSPSLSEITHDVTKDTDIAPSKVRKELSSSEDQYIITSSQLKNELGNSETIVHGVPQTKMIQLVTTSGEVRKESVLTSAAHPIEHNSVIQVMTEQETRPDVSGNVAGTNSLLGEYGTASSKPINTGQSVEAFSEETITGLGVVSPKPIINTQGIATEELVSNGNYESSEAIHEIHPKVHHKVIATQNSQETTSTIVKEAPNTQTTEYFTTEEVNAVAHSQQMVSGKSPPIVNSFINSETHAIPATSDAIATATTSHVVGGPIISQAVHSHVSASEEKQMIQSTLPGAKIVHHIERKVEPVGSAALDGAMVGQGSSTITRYITTSTQHEIEDDSHPHTVITQQSGAPLKSKVIRYVTNVGTEAIPVTEEYEVVETEDIPTDTVHTLGSTHVVAGAPGRSKIIRYTRKGGNIEKLSADLDSAEARQLLEQRVNKSITTTIIKSPRTKIIKYINSEGVEVEEIVDDSAPEDEIAGHPSIPLGRGHSETITTDMSNSSPYKKIIRYVTSRGKEQSTIGQDGGSVQVIEESNVQPSVLPLEQNTGPASLHKIVSPSTIQTIRYVSNGGGIQEFIDATNNHNLTPPGASSSKVHYIKVPNTDGVKQESHSDHGNPPQGAMRYITIPGSAGSGSQSTTDQTSKFIGGSPTKYIYPSHSGAKYVQSLQPRQTSTIIKPASYVSG